MLAAFGRVDVLINNAGGLIKRTRIEDYSLEFIQEVIALNVTQVAMFVHEVIPVMRSQEGGSVINVSSIAARHGGGAGAIIYAGAKGFISTATHGWAKEVASDGIRVNAVSPGVIATPFHERYSTAEQLKAMQATIPMNRLGTPGGMRWHLCLPRVRRDERLCHGTGDRGQRRPVHAVTRGGRSASVPMIRSGGVP